MKIRALHLDLAFFLLPLLIYFAVAMLGGMPDLKWTAVSFAYVLIRLLFSLFSKRKGV